MTNFFNYFEKNFSPKLRFFFNYFEIKKFFPKMTFFFNYFEKKFYQKWRIFLIFSNSKKNAFFKKIFL